MGGSSTTRQLGRRNIPSIVEIPPFTFSFASALLLRQTLFLRRTRRFRWASFLWDHKGRAHNGRKPRIRGLAVLPLTSPVARDDSHPAVRVQTCGKLQMKAFALFVGHRRRVWEIPQELDASRRRVDMLPTGASRSSRTVFELRAWNGDLRGNAQVDRVIHGRGPLRVRSGWRRVTPPRL